MNRVLAARPVARTPIQARRIATPLLVMGLAASPFLEPVFGRLGQALVLLLVLPPLAAALAALGWPAWLAARLMTVRTPVTRVLVAYVAWIAASSFLGLDVAVLVAAFVAVAAAPPNSPERRVHLIAAVVGANVGSMLFPFSNLTNLVVAGGAGVSFDAYVGVAWPVQAAAAVAGAAVLANAARDLRGNPALAAPVRDEWTFPGAPALVAGAIAALAGVAAVVLGFAGGDVAVPFAVAAAAAVAVAMRAGAISRRGAVRSLPVTGLGLVVAAALLAAVAPGLAGSLPRPPDGLLGVVAIAVVGGILAAVVNNLPAALIGALWLGPVAPAAVLAYLIGTNIAAIATPHGSVATMLARSVAARESERLSVARYLRRGWRLALPPALAALATIALLVR